MNAGYIWHIGLSTQNDCDYLVLYSLQTVFSSVLCRALPTLTFSILLFHFCSSVSVYFADICHCTTNIHQLLYRSWTGFNNSWCRQLNWSSQLFARVTRQFTETDCKGHGQLHNHCVLVLVKFTDMKMEKVELAESWCIASVNWLFLFVSNP